MELYLVTGGAGFIGSHLVEELLKRGHRVRVIDNFLTGKRENLASFADKIELLEADIRDSRACTQAVRGVNYVLHQAALPSVSRSIEDPLLVTEINVGGTLNLLIASAEAKIKRFVFASSTAVYGDDPHLPKIEEREGNPLSPYALSKLAAEKYCQIFSRIYGLSTICLRYFNVFGPRQDPFSPYAAVIPNFIMKFLRGEQPPIFGDGEQSRDFVYVLDVVEANLLASQAEDVSGEIFNIARGVGITVNSLAAQIKEILRTPLGISYEKSRPGEIRYSFADISKARKMLKYNPKFSLREGLEKTIRWFRERK